MGAREISFGVHFELAPDNSTGPEFLDRGPKHLEDLRKGPNFGPPMLYVGARCLGAGPKVWEPQYSNNSLLTSQFPNKMSWFQIPHPGNRFVQRLVQVTASPTVPPLHPQLHTLLTTTPSYLLSADTPSTKKKSIYSMFEVLLLFME